MILAALKWGREAGPRHRLAVRHDVALPRALDQPGGPRAGTLLAQLVTSMLRAVGLCSGLLAGPRPLGPCRGTHSAPRWQLRAVAGETMSLLRNPQPGDGRCGRGSFPMFLFANSELHARPPSASSTALVNRPVSARYTRRPSRLVAAPHWSSHWMMERPSRAPRVLFFSAPPSVGVSCVGNVAGRSKTV